MAIRACALGVFMVGIPSRSTGTELEESNIATVCEAKGDDPREQGRSSNVTTPADVELIAITAS